MQRARGAMEKATAEPERQLQTSEVALQGFIGSVAESE
jgi:hypothetical protein